MYQNVMWPAGSTPERPTAHASSIIPGPLVDGVQTLFSTFHWGPGEAMPGTGHGLVKITYTVKDVLAWFASGQHYPPGGPDDFDPYEPNSNPLFTYSGPHLVAQHPGRAHGNIAPFRDQETGRFHLWMTTFNPKASLAVPRDPAALAAARDRRIFYTFSDDPEPWTSIGKWAAPVEWSDREGLWARAPPVVFDDGGKPAWLLAHGDEATWLPEHGNDWSVRFAVSHDKGWSWAFSKLHGVDTIADGPFPGRGGILQPSVVQLADGSLHCLCRSLRGCIVELRSQPGGRLGLDWTVPRDTPLPNNNSGIAHVRLRHGTPVRDHLVLAYNPTRHARYPVSIAESRDGGLTWRLCFDLRAEQGELSYPWITQTPDGLVHCCYSLHRQTIAHDVFHASFLDEA